MDKTKAVSVLTDLIKVNQDRISAYSKVLTTIRNSKELTSFFDDAIKQAIAFVRELQEEIITYGFSVPPIALPQTSVYTTWKDFDIVLNGYNTGQLLASCEYGEAATEAVYNKALDETGIPANAVILLLKQRREIKGIQQKIKTQRDAKFLSVEEQAV